MTEITPTEDPQRRLEDGLTLLRRLRQATVSSGIKTVLSHAATFTDALIDYASHPIREVQSRFDALTREYYGLYNQYTPLYRSTIATAAPINTIIRLFRQLREFRNPYDLFKTTPHFRNHPGLSEEILRNPGTTIIAPLSTDYIVARTVETTFMGEFPQVLPVALSADAETCIFDEGLDLRLRHQKSPIVVIFTDLNDTGTTAQAVFDAACNEYPDVGVIANGNRMRLV